MRRIGFSPQSRTVTVGIGQTISRAGLEAGSWLIDRVLFEGRNLSEKAPAIKRKRPKNAASHDIDCRQIQAFSAAGNASKPRLGPEQASRS